jgi:transposase
MTKVKQIIGVDVSKDKFDVWNSLTGHHSYTNNSTGFKKFLKSIDFGMHCVMESTACYYQQLALFLYENNIAVSVVNPISIKRFIQMKLQQNKTDKSDSRMIALYGQEQSLRKWKPAPEHIEHCRQLQSVIELYLKQNTSLKNQIQSFESLGITKGILMQSLKRQLERIRKEIALLESEVETLLRQHEADLYVNLNSIPGIGKKTAALLIILTNGFRNFENYRQVSSFFGLSPVEFSSGSSVHGRSRISKRGNRKMRNHLFMCSFTACYCNPQCNLLFTRLLNKGKSKKLALIAVCNKLIKQSFSIAKSGLPYDPAYRSAYVYQ